jgi:hypothetical protein
LRERRRLDAGRHAAEQFNGAVEFGGPPLAVVLGLGEQPNAALGLGYAEASRARTTPGEATDQLQANASYCMTSADAGPVVGLGDPGHGGGRPA